MIARMELVIVSLSVALLSVSPSALAQDHRGIHDQSYTSPTWGYHLRWDSDAWTVTDEASDQDGDRLWLTDTIGNVVGVVGQPGYGGDAQPCLEDMHAFVQGLEGATNIEVVFDEDGNRQSAQDPRWSWEILLVRLPVAQTPVDYVAYLDCRTLVPGQAVLQTMLVAPAATFYDDVEHYRLLRFTVPRSALVYDQTLGILTTGSATTTYPAIPYGEVCGSYPNGDQLVYGADGQEAVLVTSVDGPVGERSLAESAATPRVVWMENLGPDPLLVGPQSFIFTAFHVGDDPVHDVAAPEFIWEDTGGNDERSLAPGEVAVAQVRWPRDLDVPQDGVNLDFRANETADYVTVDMIVLGGGCGGGSRPKIRLSR